MFGRKKDVAGVAYLPEGRYERKRKRFYSAVLTAAVVFYLLADLAAWFILRTPTFQIKEVRFVGGEEATNGRVASVILSRAIRGSFWRAVLGVNNMLVWPGTLDGEGLAFLPDLKSVTIEKNYEKGAVTVKIEERMPYGIWCEAGTSPEVGDCWWFDEEGVIFKRAIFTEGSVVTTVLDYSQSGLGLRKKVLPEKFIANALSVFDVLRDSGLAVKAMRLNDLKLEELEVLIFGGPKFYFSLRFPANSLREVIRNFSGQGGFANLQYLDFRVENRVYYK